MENFPRKVLKDNYNKYIFSESTGLKDNRIRLLSFYPLELFSFFVSLKIYEVDFQDFKIFNNFTIFIYWLF